MLKISFIIPNFKGEVHLAACLQSLGEAASVLVVDNASKPSWLKLMKSRFPQVKWLENKLNLGFAPAINQGLIAGQEKGDDYLVLLNNDVIVPDNFVKDLIQFIKSHPQIVLFSPKIYFAPGYEFHQQRYLKKERGQVIWYAGGQIDRANWLFSHRGVDEVDQGQWDKLAETDFVTGCCLVIKTELVKKIGLMDKRYFAYFEDVDYSFRAQKQGFKTWYVPQLYLWHKNAGSSASGSLTHDYLLSRNRLLLSARHAPLKTHLLVLKEAIGLLRHGRPGQKQGVKDFFLRRFGQGSLKL